MRRISQRITKRCRSRRVLPGCSMLARLGLDRLERGPPQRALLPRAPDIQRTITPLVHFGKLIADPNRVGDTARLASVDSSAARGASRAC